MWDVAWVLGAQGALWVPRDRRKCLRVGLGVESAHLAHRPREGLRREDRSACRDGECGVARAQALRLLVAASSALFGATSVGSNDFTSFFGELVVCDGAECFPCEHPVALLKLTAHGARSRLALLVALAQARWRWIGSQTMRF